MSNGFPGTVAARHTGRAAARRTWDTVCSHPIEMSLFAVLIPALLATIAITVRTALGTSSEPADLTYSSTLAELSKVLARGGQDRLARLEHAILNVQGRDIAVDTIAVLIEPADAPAATPGGFIADHVALFNDHSIRQALIGATHGMGLTGGDTEAPSLLTSVRTETGEWRLSEYANPHLLTVRSPYAERSWRSVRTADWSSGGSLLGMKGEVAFTNATADRSRHLLNGRDCLVRKISLQFLLYCESEMGSDVGRFYDVGFDFSGRESDLLPSHVLQYRPRGAPFNGGSRTFTKAEVRAGDVLHIPAIGPFMLSAAQRGTLATAQWINGRQTFSNQRIGTISFFGGAGRLPASGSPSTPLVLSLDAALSADLEYAARRFFEAQPSLRRMSVVLLDVRTGEVKAIAEPAQRSETSPLLAFEPLLVGSVVKPLVAAAILSQQPRLADLRITYAGDTVRAVAGEQLERGFANAANGCTGTIGFTDFIRCSSNQYAAELLMRSIRADGFQGNAGSAIVPRAVLERSAIGNGLAAVFDVDAYARRTSGRNPGLWTAASTGAESSDRTLMPWENRPWLVFPATDGTRIDLLVRYAFGGWENRWTLIGLGQAYSRIATGREVRARILSDSSIPHPMPADAATALGRVREALRHVATTGTAAGLGSQFQQTIDRRLVVLAKTGTLNERRDRFKSLALVLGMPAASRSSTELSCGLVAISYFDFRDDAAPARNRAPLPSVHTDFAHGEFASVLQRHWQRVSGCPLPSAGAGT